MILAAGLAPALQQILEFDGLRIGHVNRARQARLCASGKVLNVGLALHFLGGPSLTLAPLGGVAGESIDREFESLGVAHRWVWSQNPTRLCTTILDHSTNTTTELVENAFPVEAADLDQFHRAYDEARAQAKMVVLSGSLPAGTPRTFYRELVERTSSPVILDASGPELVAALAAKPFCVKPNRDELSRTLGRELNSDRDLQEAMQELCERGAEWALVSHGIDDLWACDGKRYYIYRPLKVPTVNPIGSGDCLAAGTAWACARGMEMLEAIRFGVAAAAENASVLLPARIDPVRSRNLVASVAFETR